MTSDKEDGRGAVFPKLAEQARGSLNRQHPVLAFLFFNPFKFYSSDAAFRNG